MLMSFAKKNYGSHCLFQLFLFPTKFDKNSKVNPKNLCCLVIAEPEKIPSFIINSYGSHFDLSSYDNFLGLTIQKQ